MTRANRYTKLWLSAIGLHALHQVEEAIDFFRWYRDNYHHIPGWLAILSLERAERVVREPGLFVLASTAQIAAASAVAFLSRKSERWTRVFLALYLSGLTFFLVWHIAASYAAHSYAPIMVTCVGGLFIIPRWMREVLAKGDASAVGATSSP